MRFNAKLAVGISLAIFTLLVMQILIMGLIFSNDSNGGLQQNAQSNMQDAKNYSMQDVSQHNSASNCWIIINIMQDINN